MLRSGVGLRGVTTGRKAAAKRVEREAHMIAEKCLKNAVASRFQGQEGSVRPAPCSATVVLLNQSAAHVVRAPVDAS